MSVQLTVFTPTYNRAYILGRLYESLVGQTADQFIWMIVDDGSTDETRSLVASWVDEDLLDIQYVYKENHGMHSAHNVAFENMDTPFMVCIDSDDFMPKDGVERILNNCKRIQNKSELAGVIGLDADKEGRVLGDPFPEAYTLGGVNEAKRKYGMTGDKKIVLKTDVVRQYPPYPLYEGERLVPLGTLYFMMERDYKFILTNEVFCNVEYMPDGSTRNILSQYRKNPNGFAYERRLRLAHDYGFLNLLKQWVHLISSCLFVKSIGPLKDAKRKYLLPLATPIGLLFHLYVRAKTSRP